MNPRPWPTVPLEPVRPSRTCIDDYFVPLPSIPLCSCGLGQGCERHGTHPRRDVPHSTRGVVGRVGALRRRA